MKKLKTVFVILSSLLSELAFGKSPIDYKITKSILDKTISKTEAVFVFKFLKGKNSLEREEITFSYNAFNKKQNTNKDGEILLKIKPGKYVFKFLYNLKHYEIITEPILGKANFRTEIEVYFRPSEEPVMAEKPVIYVYPKQIQTTSIQLNLNGEFTFTYPEYKNGWHFIANPNGTIEINDKKYHYLFWDGELNIDLHKINWQEGFIVNKTKLVSFLEDNLKAMGLNSQEMEDYITFWASRMSVNDLNYIHFIFNEEYNNYASITVNPKPDAMFRVCMLWSKINGNYTELIKPQKIETFNRNGFTVVEWGGIELKYPLKLNSL